MPFVIRRSTLPALRGRQPGFTLVELMIVVVILGILAAIAIPLYMKFVQQAKTGEAQLNLGKVASLVEQHFAKSASQQSSAAITTGSTILTGKFPNSLGSAVGSCAATPAINTESVPRLAASVSGASYQPQPNEWRCTAPAIGCSSDTAWSQMKFEISSPIRFAYCYESDTPDTGPQAFAVVASGDADGDTTWSRYERRGITKDDGSITIGGVGVTNEGE